MFSNVYKALADPSRRRVLQLLRARDMSAGELAEHFDSAWPTLSRHFAILREADLIQGEKRGASIIYSLNISVLEEALLGMMEMFQIDRSERIADDALTVAQETVAQETVAQEVVAQEVEGNKNGREESA